MRRLGIATATIVCAMGGVANAEDGCVGKSGAEGVDCSSGLETGASAIKGASSKTASAKFVEDKGDAPEEAASVTAEAPAPKQVTSPLLKEEPKPAPEADMQASTPSMPSDASSTAKAAAEAAAPKAEEKPQSAAVADEKPARPKAPSVSASAPTPAPAPKPAPKAEPKGEASVAAPAAAKPEPAAAAKPAPKPSQEAAAAPAPRKVEKPAVITATPVPEKPAAPAQTVVETVPITPVVAAGAPKREERTERRTRARDTSTVDDMFSSVEDTLDVFGGDGSGWFDGVASSGMSPAWEGPYAGATIGMVETKFSGVYDSYDPNSGKFSLDPLGESTIGGGLHAGYSWSVDRFVFGLEADAVFIGASTQAEGHETDGWPVDGYQQATAEIGWAASARARAGFAIDRLMPYVTGGFGMVDYSFTIEDDGIGSGGGAGRYEESSTLAGPVIGGGLEWMVTEGFILRAEGMTYLVGESKDLQDVTPDADPGDTLEIDDVTTFRTGLSYKF